MVGTAEGALDEISSMMQRMRELAVQAGTGTTSAADRTYLNSEFVALREAVASRTALRGMANILDGSAGASTGKSTVAFQVGRMKNRRFQPHLATSIIRMAICPACVH